MGLTTDNAMALADEIETQASKIFADAWTLRNGQVVPEPSDLKLGNDAVAFETATILYADLTGSTALVNNTAWQTAAEIYKAYLYAAAKIIKNEGGAITSYDGDRVMGVFIGENQSTQAVRAGMKINYAVQSILNPAFKRQYKSSDFVIKQVVGIDVSPIRTARTGVRGGNDLVWVGRAANFAAKLTEIKLEERTWITKSVYDRMNDSVKKSGADVNYWKSYKWSQNADHPIYGSKYVWQF